MKALIIDEPWIGLILRGEKTWEMRKTACHQRGRIGLIRKGSGQVVGVADLSGSMPTLTDVDSYSAAEPRHRIPPGRQARAFADGWRTPWVISDAEPLARPVSYDQPPGAVIWVNLDPEVAAAVSAHVGVGYNQGRTRSHADPPPITTGVLTRSDAKLGPVREASPSAGAVRDVVLTGGNLRNNHIYLPLDFFRSDAVGGSNKREVASRTITVVFRPGATVETDVDGTKRILRARAKVGVFLARSGVLEGDTVRITRTGPYSYEVEKVGTMHDDTDRADS